MTLHGAVGWGEEELSARGVGMDQWLYAARGREAVVVPPQPDQSLAMDDVSAEYALVFRQFRAGAGRGGCARRGSGKVGGAFRSWLNPSPTSARHSTSSHAAFVSSPTRGEVNSGRRRCHK